MKYKKINLSWNDHPEFLNRTLFVRSDVDLFTLGVILLESLHAKYEEDLSILDDGILYLYRIDQEELDFDVEADEFRELEDFGFEDLKQTFTLLYNDVEEPYEFTCVVEEEQNLSEDQYAFLLDGNCRCLFEDGKGLLSNYANGKIDRSTTMNDIFKMSLFVPDNIAFKTISEVEEYDLEQEQAEFNQKMQTKNLPSIVENVSDIYDMDYDDHYDEVDDIEEDGPNFLRSITEVCFATAVYQIENVPFVQEAFEKLTKKYSEEEAVLMISKVLSEEFEQIITGEYFENNKEYQKKIRSLK